MANKAKAKWFTVLSGVCAGVGLLLMFTAKTPGWFVYNAFFFALNSWYFFGDLDRNRRMAQEPKKD